MGRQRAAGFRICFHWNSHFYLHPKTMIYNTGAYLKAGAYGAALWYAAAVFLKTGKKAIMDTKDRTNLLITYVVLVPVSYVGVYGLAKIGGRGKDLIELTAVATAAATFLDAWALEWAPGLYGAATSKELGARAPAALLWGVGCALAASVHIQAM